MISSIYFSPSSCGLLLIFFLLIFHPHHLLSSLSSFFCTIFRIYASSSSLCPLFIMLFFSFLSSPRHLYSFLPVLLYFLDSRFLLHFFPTSIPLSTIYLHLHTSLLSSFILFYSTSYLLSSSSSLSLPFYSPTTCTPSPSLPWSPSVPLTYTCVLTPFHTIGSPFLPFPRLPPSACSFHLSPVS